MSDTELYKKKRGKNLAVLLLVLGWCALIFLITMAKLAHAAELPNQPRPFATTSALHQQQMDENTARIAGEGAQYRAESASAAATYKSEGAQYRAASAVTKQEFDAEGALHRDQLLQEKKNYDAEGATHRDTLAARPAQWAQEWPPPTPPP